MANLYFSQNQRAKQAGKSRNSYLESAKLIAAEHRQFNIITNANRLEENSTSSTSTASTSSCSLSAGPTNPHEKANPHSTTTSSSTSSASNSLVALENALFQQLSPGLRKEVAKWQQEKDEVFDRHRRHVSVPERPSSPPYRQFQPRHPTTTTTTTIPGRAGAGGYHPGNSSHTYQGTSHHAPAAAAPFSTTSSPPPPQDSLDQFNATPSLAQYPHQYHQPQQQQQQAQQKSSLPSFNTVYTDDFKAMFASKVEIPVTRQFHRKKTSQLLYPQANNNDSSGDNNLLHHDYGASSSGSSSSSGGDNGGDYRHRLHRKLNPGKLPW